MRNRSLKWVDLAMVITLPLLLGGDCGGVPPSDFCAANLCDDGDECTADACANQQCNNLPVTNGTPCRGGNCQEGTCELRSPDPEFTGFDFALSEGDFWEYRYKYYFKSWGGGTDIETHYGLFRLTLGGPTTIGGMQAFPVEFSGRADEGTKFNFRPRWDYLALEGNTLYGSEGGRMEVIFDAQNGYWLGGGFIAKWGEKVLCVADRWTIDNSYIKGPAIRAGLSDSVSQCEYFPGVGQICGDSSYTFRTYDFFQPNVGPVGYLHFDTYTDCGGGFCSGATWDHDVGLVVSSLRGDTVNYDLEQELNDTVAQAYVLERGRIVVGDVKAADPGFNTNLLAGGDYHSGELQVEDLYRISVPGNLTQQVSIQLTFEGAPASTDLDLYLYNATGSQAVDWSVRDNEATGIYTESINQPLAGDYLIGVEAHKASGRVWYEIRATW